jgi:hypothetical protein
MSDVAAGLVLDVVCSALASLALAEKAMKDQRSPTL